jgi:low temperature requirement protein LtrA
MVPIAVDAKGSAATGYLISPPVTAGAHPSGIFGAPPYRARPHLTHLASRLRFALVLIIATGRAVVATSRRAE